MSSMDATPNDSRFTAEAEFSNRSITHFTALEKLVCARSSDSGSIHQASPKDRDKTQRNKDHTLILIVQATRETNLALSNGVQGTLPAEMSARSSVPKGN